MITMSIIATVFLCIGLRAVSFGLRVFGRVLGFGLSLIGVLLLPVGVALCLVWGLGRMLVACAPVLVLLFLLGLLGDVSV